MVLDLHNYVVIQMPKTLEEMLDFVKGLSSRIDYLEDELSKLLEALERIDKDVAYLKNPFSRM